MRAAAPRPLSRSQFRPAPFISSARSIQPALSRWYSAEADSAQKPSSEPAKEEGSSTKASAEAQEGSAVSEADAALKKEL